MSTILYNKSLSGRIYSAEDVYGVNANYTSFVSASTGTSSGSVRVQLTGWYIQGNSGQFWQILSGEWVLSSECTFISDTTLQYNSADAQRLVNRIIQNNKHVYENNLLCARFATRLDTEQRQQLYTLQKRLEARDTALRNASLISEAETSYPQGYIEFSSALQSFMASGGVGVVVSTTAVIVISAVVIAAVSTAAYFAFKAWAEESDDDVEFSDDLTKTLTSKLTDDEFAQLKSETAGLITKARIKERFSSISGVMKYVILGFGIYTIYKLIKDKRKTIN